MSEFYVRQGRDQRRRKELDVDMSSAFAQIDRLLVRFGEVRKQFYEDIVGKAPIIFMRYMRDTMGNDKPLFPFGPLADGARRDRLNVGTGGFIRSFLPNDKYNINEVERAENGDVLRMRFGSSHRAVYRLKGQHPRPTERSKRFWWAMFFKEAGNYKSKLKKKDLNDRLKERLKIKGKSAEEGDRFSPAAQFYMNMATLIDKAGEGYRLDGKKRGQIKSFEQATKRFETEGYEELLTLFLKNVQKHLKSVK